MYLNKKQLIERGWSAKLVNDFLGEPDDEHRLGYYCYEHRYFLSRVERVERKEDFKSAQEKYLKRRASALEVAKERAARQIEAAKTTPIRVREISAEDALDEAIYLYNAQNRGRRYDDDDYYREPASRDSDALFLERITVNYIRHNLTTYDSKLFAQKGKVGGSDAIPIIRRRVFEEIALAFPNLADECDRQMIRRGLKSESELLPKVYYEQLELPFCRV
jgi:hypothetical protein